MVVWNPKKNRVLYREDKDGNRVYPFPEDNPDNQKPAKQEPKEPTAKELKAICDEQGIEYPKNAKKADLIKLLQGE